MRFQESPATNITVTPTAITMMAVPRSGCFMMKAAGTAIISMGTPRPGDSLRIDADWSW